MRIRRLGIALLPAASTAEATAAVTHVFANNGFQAPHGFSVTASRHARHETRPPGPPVGLRP
jgi:hypothetical protein